MRLTARASRRADPMYRSRRQNSQLSGTRWKVAWPLNSRTSDGIRPKPMVQIRVLVLGSQNDIRFVENLPTLLKRNARLLFDQLEQAGRANGQLRVERSARDYAAIERSGADRFTTRLETRHFVFGIGRGIRASPQPRRRAEGRSSSAQHCHPGNRNYGVGYSDQCRRGQTNKSYRRLRSQSIAINLSSFNRSRESIRFSKYRQRVGNVAMVCGS
jgi:hypothetical protein